MQMLDGIRYCEKDGINSDEKFINAFEDLDLRFITFGSNGQEVELISGGKDQSVTFSNRMEYCDLVENYRFHEADLQVIFHSLDTTKANMLSCCSL